MYINARLLLTHISAALSAGPRDDLRNTRKRRRILYVFLILYPLVRLYTGLFFALDHLFFPGFRRTAVRRPLFILGNFRSGTTFVQRTLTKERSAFTAFTTFDIYLAPSISQRKLLRGIRMVDRLVGGPLRRLLDRVERNVLVPIEAHTIRFAYPEEDEGLFLYPWDGFFTWFFFPQARTAQSYARFDMSTPAYARRRAMQFYRGCVQRHLYDVYSRTSARPAFLSKNPAFTGMSRSLIDEFPDARFIFMLRRPEQMLPSIMRWFQLAIHYFSDPPWAYPDPELILEITDHWYRDPPRTLSQALPADRWQRLAYDTLFASPAAELARVLAAIGYAVDGHMCRTLDQAQLAAADHEPAPPAVLGDFGISEQRVRDRFGDLDFGPGGPLLESTTL